MAIYPRKQTIFIFIIALMAVGGVAYYVHGGFPDKKSDITQSDETAPLIATASQSLPANTDWQKQFLDKTNNDTIFKSSSKNSEKPTYDAPTATEILARNFMVKYKAIKDSGISPDDKTVAQIMSQVAQESLVATKNPKTYTITDLKNITEKNDYSTFREYSQNIKFILTTYFHQKNEVAIARTASEENDLSTLKNIDPIIRDYGKAISGLLTTAVPKELVTYHVRLLNAVSMSLYGAQAFRKMEADPITALSATSLEVPAIQQMLDSISGIEQILLKKGISLES